MLVQFSEECETSQADDILWLYARLNDESYLPVGRLNSIFGKFAAKWLKKDN